jgi:Cdc6-like AAA superfamily ATPase
MYQDTNQISGQSVQAKNVNVHAMDDIFFVFTMVQNIMTELSGAVTDEEKVAVITKAVFTLLKNNANNSS